MKIKQSKINMTKHQVTGINRSVSRFLFGESQSEITQLDGKDTNKLYPLGTDELN